MGPSAPNSTMSPAASWCGSPPSARGGVGRPQVAGPAAGCGGVGPVGGDPDRVAGVGGDGEVDDGAVAGAEAVSSVPGPVVGRFAGSVGLAGGWGAWGRVGGVVCAWVSLLVGMARDATKPVVSGCLERHPPAGRPRHTRRTTGHGAPTRRTATWRPAHGGGRVWRRQAASSSSWALVSLVWWPARVLRWSTAAWARLATVTSSAPSHCSAANTA